MAPNLTQSGDKPVAWSGQTAQLQVRGLPTNASVSFRIDDLSLPPSDVTTESANGITNISVPVKNASQPTIHYLRVDGNAQLFNITVLPEPGTLPFVEDPTWTEMFESTALDGWTSSGWTFEAMETLVTDRRMRWFVRGSGRVAFANGSTAAAADAATLTSPEIPLPQGETELRFASHYNATGALATVTASYDGRPPVTIANFNQSVFSTQERIPLTAGNASSVRFTWTLAPQQVAPVAQGPDGAFWVIDDVELVRPLPPLSEDTPLETIDIISDIQGLKANTWMSKSVLPGLRKLSNASTLVMNGDLVFSSTDYEYRNFTAELNSTGAHAHYHDIISVMGNHERIVTNDTDTTERFFRFTGMRGVGGAESGDGLWGEIVTEGGTPIVWLASETYDFKRLMGMPPYATLSDAQFLFVAQRLAHWRTQRRQVLLFTHHPLPNSVSDTRGQSPFVDDTTRLQYLLAANPHALLVSSHTHFDVGYNDQNTHYRPVVGNAGRVWAFNTGALLDRWSPTGSDASGNSTSALQARIYKDRIQMRAYKFLGQGTDGVLVHQRDVGAPTNGTNGPSGNGTGTTPDNGADKSHASHATLRHHRPWGGLVCLALVLVVW